MLSKEVIFSIYVLIDILGTYLLLCMLRFFNNNLIKNKKIELCSYMAVQIINFLMVFLISKPRILIIFNLFFIFCLTFNYATTIKRRFFSVIITVMIFFLTEAIAVFFFGESFQTVTISTRVNICAKVLQFAIWLLLNKFLRPSKKSKKSNIQWYLPVMFLTLLLYLDFVLQYAYFNKSQIILGLVLMTVMILALVYVYKMNQEKERIIIERTLLIKKNESYGKQYELLQKSYNAFNELRHDLAENFIRMKELELDNEKLNAYMNQTLMDTICAERLLIKTDNIGIDSVLSIKIREATEKGIKVNHKVTVPIQMNVETFDMSVVLDNLMDIAIKENSYAENKGLNFVMRYDVKDLFIFLIHPYDSNGKKGKKEFLKRNKDHMEEINNVLERYSGNMDYQMDEEKVIWSILMFVD